MLFRYRCSVHTFTFYDPFFKNLFIWILKDIYAYINEIITCTLCLYGYLQCHLKICLIPPFFLLSSSNITFLKCQHIAGYVRSLGLIIVNFTTLGQYRYNLDCFSQLSTILWKYLQVKSYGLILCNVSAVFLSTVSSGEKHYLNCAAINILVTMLYFSC